uniref:Uncharacterized protein n=1 Tax=Davidia involucrata TaxID=16924 RepID=A0A5B7CA40_DAVIN
MGHHHCCSKQKVKRGLWSPEEDEKLIKHITTHGHGCWSSVPKLAGLQRCGKSCRLRWINYLRPDLKRGSFSEQEERIIIDVHRILGNRWAQIAKHLPGRTDNEVKNFWNSCIKKRLIAQGLDPNSHNLLSSHHHHDQFDNNNINNASKLLSHHHIHQQTCPSVFSVSSTSQTTNNCKDINASISIDMKTPFVTLMPLPVPHENSSSTINTTFECQNLLNFSSTVVGDQNYPPDSLMGTSSTAMSSSSSLSPSEFGIVDENCLWGTTNFEPTRQEEEMQIPEKICEGEIDKANGLSCATQNINMDSFDSSNFDFEFVESALMPCGMYCDVSSMDQLAWDH